MLRAELLARARSAKPLIGTYRLGAGAPHDALSPYDLSGACDCSGFVCWALGIVRYQPTLAFLQAAIGHRWMNTDAIVADTRHPAGLFFPPVEAARPGDLIVYPSYNYAQRTGLAERGDKRGPTIGHVGIVTGDKSVIHCSSGNVKEHGRAIWETDNEVFRRVPYTRIARYVGLED